MAFKREVAVEGIGEGEIEDKETDTGKISLHIKKIKLKNLKERLFKLAQ